MGTATRVRVTFEFRNGDNHFLELAQGDFVPTPKGLADIDALERAFISTLRLHAGKQDAIRQLHAASNQTPHHD